MSTSDRQDSNRVTKAAWKSPELRELGNLRNFVRTGHAFGKSGAPADGESDPGGESMVM
jgi:hypothetical protein